MRNLRVGIVLLIVVAILGMLLAVLLRHQPRPQNITLTAKGPVGAAASARLIVDGVERTWAGTLPAEIKLAARSLSFEILGPKGQTLTVGYTVDGKSGGSSQGPGVVRGFYKGPFYFRGAQYGWGSLGTR